MHGSCLCGELVFEVREPILHCINAIAPYAENKQVPHPTRQWLSPQNKSIGYRGITWFRRIKSPPDFAQASAQNAGALHQTKSVRHLTAGSQPAFLTQPAIFKSPPICLLIPRRHGRMRLQVASVIKKYRPLRKWLSISMHMQILSEPFLN